MGVKKDAKGESMERLRNQFDQAKLDGNTDLIEEDQGDHGEDQWRQEKLTGL
jgi:hypothetical protein